MLRRATLAVLLALPVLVVGGSSSQASVVIPTVHPSRGTATAWYSAGGGGSIEPYVNLFLKGTLSFGLNTYQGEAWLGLSLEGTTPILIYSPADLGYKQVGTCHEVDTAYLALQAPATATLECLGRFGDSGPKGFTVIEVVLPKATPVSQYHYDMRYDGTYAG